MNETTLNYKGAIYKARPVDLDNRPYALCAGCALENTEEAQNCKCPTEPHCCAQFRNDKTEWAAHRYTRGFNIMIPTINDYNELGFRNRDEYLESLAEDYGIPLDIVLLLADLYGPLEDFDGLVTAVEDYADGF